MRAWTWAAALGLAGAAWAQQDYGQRQAPEEERPERQKPQARMEAAWYDNWISGVHFRLDPDGRVFLMVPETNAQGRREFKTYQAESMEEFKRQHAEAARKHDLDRLFGATDRAPEGDRAQARHFQSHDELRRWMDRQEQALQDRLREWRQQGGRDMPRDRGPYGRDEDRPDRGGRSLGVVVAPVEPALRTHLRLEEGQGFVVHQVQEGSLAEKAGLRKYDVIAKLMDRNVQDFQEFRRGLDEALSQGKAFELGIIRNGHRQTLKVEPQAEGKEVK